MSSTAVECPYCISSHKFMYFLQYNDYITTFVFVRPVKFIAKKRDEKLTAYIKLCGPDRDFLLFFFVQ